MGRLCIVKIQAFVGCSAGKLNSSHSANIPSVFKIHVRQKCEKKHLQLSPLLKISHLLGGFGILILNRSLAVYIVNLGHSGFCRAWDPSVVTRSLWKMLPTKDHKSRTGQPCHDSVSLVQLLLNSGLLMQCLRETWPKYPFTEGCRNPRNDCPLEIHPCLPPATFRQPRCTRDAPQWNFGSSHRCSIMVSCKLALTDPDKRTPKYSATVSTFSILQVPKIRILIWPQEMSQWSQPQPGKQLPEWQFLYLYTCLCTASTSVRHTKKHRSRGCFLLEQL